MFISLLGVSQTGRHREGRNQKRFHKHTNKLKHRKTPGYRKHEKSLFYWNVTKNKRSVNKMQLRINRERARRRLHGNNTFAKRKY